LFGHLFCSFHTDMCFFLALLAPSVLRPKTFSPSIPELLPLVLADSFVSPSLCGCVGFLSISSKIFLKGESKPPNEMTTTSVVIKMLSPTAEPSQHSHLPKAPLSFTLSTSPFLWRRVTFRSRPFTILAPPRFPAACL